MDVQVVYRYAPDVRKGLEHLQILVCAGLLEPVPHKHRGTGQLRVTFAFGACRTELRTLES